MGIFKKNKKGLTSTIINRLEEMLYNIQIEDDDKKRKEMMEQYSNTVRYYQSKDYDIDAYIKVMKKWYSGEK